MLMTCKHEKDCKPVRMWTVVYRKSQIEEPVTVRVEGFRKSLDAIVAAGVKNMKLLVSVDSTVWHPVLH